MEEAQSILSNPDLVAAATRSQATLDWETALSLYTQSLERTPQEERDLAFLLLEARPERYRHLDDLAGICGRFSERDRDLLDELVGWVAATRRPQTRCQERFLTRG